MHVRYVIYISTCTVHLCLLGIHLYKIQCATVKHIQYTCNFSCRDIYDEWFEKFLNIQYIAQGDGAPGNFLRCIEKIEKKVSFKEANTPPPLLTPTKTHDWTMHANVLKKDFFLVYKIKLRELMEQRFEFDLNTTYRKLVSYLKKDFIEK